MFKHETQKKSSAGMSVFPVFIKNSLIDEFELGWAEVFAKEFETRSNLLSGKLPKFHSLAEKCLGEGSLEFGNTPRRFFGRNDRE